MNAWKIRHEGSPVASADLTYAQVTQGLIDGKLHPEDEVKGPNDPDWVKFEDHPAFAETVAELELPEDVPHEEETNLDMNPMIDVALVLLVFFILTTTYASLQKIIEAASVTNDPATQYRIVKPEEAKETMVHIRVVQDKGATNIFVEKEAVSLDDLEAKLRPFARDPKRRTVLLEHASEVPFGVIVQIQDRARLAKMEKIALLTK